jgi:ABC-type polysaccharide/polyol phosphate export permease
VVRMSLRTAVAHRNLLYLLSLKELRTRYRKSVLGWTWSLLNPLSQMVIFSILFLYIFERPAPVGTSSGLQNFPLYFLAGLLPFQFFSISVTTAIGSVQGGASLIKKVAFPHEHLVLSIVIAQLVTLLIELAVLSIAILIFGQMVLPWLFPMAALLVLVTMFTTGVALLLSAANVFFHDINYLWGIVAQLLFYTSPIIYTPGEIDNRWLVAITNWGPTGSIVRASQGLLYHGDMPGIGRWIHIASFSIVTLAFGAWAFNRLSPRFAEEL